MQPFPDPYLMGAKRLGADITKCSSFHSLPFQSLFFSQLASTSRLTSPLRSPGLVVEDAPAGAQSGLAAGSIVLAVGTGYAPKLVKAVSPFVLSLAPAPSLPFSLL